MKRAPAVARERDDRRKSSTFLVAVLVHRKDEASVHASGDVGGFIWFWNASYDWRNVHQMFALLAASMAAGLHFEVAGSRARLIRAGFHGLIVVAGSGHILSACNPATLVALPPTWRLPPESRPAAVFGPGFALLSASPLARNAHHLYAQNAFVWLLGKKVVYGWHPLVRTVPPAPGDLATVTHPGGRNTADPTGPCVFETVSGFRTQRLEMVRPDYASVPATLVREGAADAPQPLPVTITAPGVYWLELEASAAGGDVVLFRVDVAAGKAGPRMLIGREWNALSSFRNLCGFVRDADSFKALFWLDRVESGKRIPALPPLAISKIDDHPMTLTAAHMGIIKADASPETAAP